MELGFVIMNIGETQVMNILDSYRGSNVAKKSLGLRQLVKSPKHMFAMHPFTWAENMEKFVLSKNYCSDRKANNHLIRVIFLFN